MRENWKSTGIDSSWDSCNSLLRSANISHALCCPQRKLVEFCKFNVC